MAHHHAEVQEEKYIFRPETKKKLYILLIVGIVLFAGGLLLAISNEGKSHDEGHGGHGGGHASTGNQEMVASVAQEHHAGDSLTSDSTAVHGTENPSDHAEPAHEEHAEAAHAAESHEAHAGAEHHESPVWKRRLFSTLWHNNVFFTGLGIIGLFFVAIQYAAQAGWSAGVKRVGLAMGTWIPFAGILMLGLWAVTNHDIFHWTHKALYDTNDAGYDKVISGKAAFFFWPLAGGSFPVFFLARMVIFFGMWYWFFTLVKKKLEEEDLDNSTKYWYKIRVISAWFLIFFAVSSSVSAWDWVMSIDTHWFSTMFGWYVFASWWVTGLATITLIVVSLKNAGYLKVVNANHLHDLGKFCFAFSIFWTYIWFGQFLLIYYANIPEEVTYFMERMRNSPYNWIFYLNLIVNFVLPFLMLMTRDAKRQLSMLRVVCPIIIIGHWFDFFNMVTPGVMKHDGTIGILEIGTAFIFAAVYLLVVLNSLSKRPLFGKNDPMLQESINHHI